MSFPFYPAHELAGHVLASPLAEGAVHLSAITEPGALAGLGATAVAGLAIKASHTLAHRHTQQWPGLWLRLKWRVHPGPGFADRWELWRRYGKPEARRVAKRGRPSLTWTDRYFGSWTQYAAYHGRAQGWIHPWRVYSTFEDITLVIAPPQEGKSARAAGDILDAPGPVVATSIRADLIDATAGLRARAGRLHIFNPEAVGNYASTFKINPVAGCQDVRTAIRWAGHMVGALTNAGLSDADFWSDQAALTLAAYMHAAGLIGANMVTVYRWIMERSDEPVAILSRHPGAVPNALMQVNEYRAMPDKTRSGVITTLGRVLKFMTDPNVVEMLSPAPREGLDVTSFLTSRDTLYLVAADAGSPVAPLFVAFLAELTHHARLHPARTGMPRLDPPLTLVLDEVANIAPVPVANWATWAAGSGIRITLYVQAWAQIEQRWGKEGAAVIWQSAKTKVIFTSVSEDTLCEMVSTLCGQVRVRVGWDIREDRDGKKHRTPRYDHVDVLPAAAVRQLPDGRAIVIRRNARPTIVRAEKYWDRADVKAYKRTGQTLNLPRPFPRPIPQVRPDLAGAPVAEGTVVELRPRPVEQPPADQGPADQAPPVTDVVAPWDRDARGGQ